MRQVRAGASGPFNTMGQLGAGASGPLNKVDQLRARAPGPLPRSWSSKTESDSAVCKTPLSRTYRWERHCEVN